MPKVIAVVRLAAGRVAYYDELSRIHLTINNPIANITDDMNIRKIQKAIKNKSLTLVSGSLDVSAIKEDVSEFIPVKDKTPKVKVETKKVNKEVKENVVETVESIPVKEEIKEEVKEEAQETIEPVVEEKVEETKTTKRRKKKEE
jgi:hypothetical protein